MHDFLPAHSFVDENGRPAETHLTLLFHVLHRQQRWNMSAFGLVGIAIHTGRRHQIRVHVQWEGHPTVTDEKYAHRSVNVCWDSLELDPRLCRSRIGDLP